MLESCSQSGAVERQVSSTIRIQFLDSMGYNPYTFEIDGEVWLWVLLTVNMLASGVRT